MKLVKQILGLIILTLIMASFSQCSSAQKLQKEAPTTFGEVYFQKWIAGVEGGGSGVNIFIEVLGNDTQLDSVYFHGKAAKLESKPANQSLYIGRFVSEFNKKEDMVISSDSKMEYGNKPTELLQKIPFELENDECVVSYLDGNKIKYYMLKSIKEKPSINYPMARQPDNN